MMIMKVETTSVIQNYYHPQSLKSNHKIFVAKKGDQLLYLDSFIEHKVKPVTKGTRYSVVAWYGGPPFK